MNLIVFSDSLYFESPDSIGVVQITRPQLLTEALLMMSPLADLNRRPAHYE